MGLRYGYFLIFGLQSEGKCTTRVFSSVGGRHPVKPSHGQKGGRWALTPERPETHTTSPISSLCSHCVGSILTELSLCCGKITGLYTSVAFLSQFSQ